MKIRLLQIGFAFSLAVATAFGLARLAPASPIPAVIATR
jgi:hypothetical protein